MRFLKKKRNYLISGGAAGTLTLGGGVDDACKDRCMQRMKCWFRLALDVCKAEFPHFEAVNAFRIFELSGGDIALHGGGDEDCHFLEPLQRLSAIFGCDLDTAYAQYKRHLPLARSEKLAQCTHTNLSAWQAAIQRTQKHMKHSKATSALWGSDTIRKLLVHFGSCCPGTSPIERMFSRMEKQWGTRLNNSDIGSVLDTMELHDLTEDNKGITMKMACEIWSLRFPPTRGAPAKTDPPRHRTASEVGRASSFWTTSAGATPESPCFARGKYRRGRVIGCQPDRGCVDPQVGERARFQCQESCAGPSRSVPPKRCVALGASPVCCNCQSSSRAASESHHSEKTI